MHSGEAARCLIFAISLILVPQGAQARDTGRSSAFEAVVACRTISELQVRLACFDRSVAAMEAAEESGQLIVINRQQAEKAQRGIFGLPLPSVSAIFRRSGENNPHEEINQIETTLKQVTDAGYGKWIFMLEEGGTWATTEAVSGRVPKVGEHIVIKRASLGGYVLSTNSGRAVRVKRLN